MTLTISWSQVRLFDECRQKVRLLREGKRARGADARMFFPGTVTDRVVRDWLAEHPGERGLMVEMVDDIMVREEQLLRKDENRIVKWKDAQDKENVRAECRRAAELIEPILFKYVLPHKYEVDRRFKTPLTIPIFGEPTKIALIGALDIRVYNEERDWWAIFDVKHTKDDGYWRKTQGQMTFYDIFNMADTGQHAKALALFQPLCKAPVKPIPVDDDRRSEMLARIITMAEAITSQDLGVTQKRKSECVYCDFKHACSRFKPVVAPDGRKTIAY